MQNIIGIVNGILIGGNPSGGGGVIPPPFAPSDIAGLKLWLDADAANVNTEAAADFDGTNQYLSSASTAFDKGDESFSFGCWVNLDSLPASGVNRGIMGNMNPSDFEGFGLRVTNNSGVIRFKYYIEDSLGAGTDLSADIFGTPSINTWHFISCVYDSINDLMKINVDGGAFNTVSQTTGAGGKSGLTIGTDAVLVNRYIDSKIDLSFFYDKALSISEVTALYNSGNAIAYDSLSAAQKTDLVSWWSLSETSGIRYDQVITSANNLTDNNSVGWAVGVLSEPVVNNSPVSLWIDKSTATNNATQATAISQATWKSSGFGTNSKPYLNFDGVNDFMSVANSSDIQLQAMTIFMVNLPRVNAAFEGALDKWGSSQGWMIEYTSGATQGQTRITAGTSSLLSSVDVTNLENITSILIDGASSSISVNGVTTTGTLNVTPTITQDLILGGDNVSTLRLDVDMAEILIYNAVLTSGEITQVETYLNTKYAAYSPPIGAFSSAFSNAFNIT